MQKMFKINNAKLSAINNNKKRIKLSDRLYKKRQALKKIVMDKNIPLEERKPYTIEKKITFNSLVRKFIGKKIRIYLSKLKKIFRK